MESYGNLGIPGSKGIVNLIYFSRYIEILDAKILHFCMMFRNLEIEFKSQTQFRLFYFYFLFEVFRVRYIFSHIENFLQI